MASLYQKGGGSAGYSGGLLRNGGGGGSYGGSAFGSDPSYRSPFGPDPLSLYGSAASYTPPAASWQTPSFSSLKRPGEEVFYSGDSLSKRPRFETPQLFTPFPQRPGEKDCIYYMRTRTCNFGANCKFDHPAWVPVGGIPDWKEVSTPTTKTHSLPVREGEPDCSFYVKTGSCKFGANCKFNHPENSSSVEGTNGNWKASDEAGAKTGASIITNGNVEGEAAKPATGFNAKGLPLRPEESDCSFYLKTGSCKYGSACRFNHPASVVIQQSQTTVAPVLGGFTAPYGNFSIFPGALPDYGFGMPGADLGLSSMASPTIYPQRPGETSCVFYMKTGFCKFASTCKFHHPIDRKEPATKVTLAGYPRREGEQACPFYMKTGTCKYALTCKFDHPPPGEAAAKAVAEAEEVGAGSR